MSGLDDAFCGGSGRERAAGAGQQGEESSLCWAPLVKEVADRGGVRLGSGASGVRIARGAHQGVPIVGVYWRWRCGLRVKQLSLLRARQRGTRPQKSPARPGW